MEVNIEGVMYEEVKNSEIIGCLGCVAYDDHDLCGTFNHFPDADCNSVALNWKVWKIKEVKESIKPKEKEVTMQKKEIDKSKKYKTTNGIDVELIYENYRDGMKYLWVASPVDNKTQKFVFATNKYGEVHSMPYLNLVEFNPLEELSKMPVDTLVKVTQKSTGTSLFRYLDYVTNGLTGVYLFYDGATSRTTSSSCLYAGTHYTFEIIE